MNITDSMECIGQQPSLKKAAASHAEKILTQQLIPAILQKALLSNDKIALEKLAGIKKDIVCFIASPAKEGEIPKDDNKTPEEDEPLHEEATLLRVS